MIYCCSFAAFEAFLLRQGFVRVGQIDSHYLYEAGDEVITVHKPNGDTITVMEVESVCDFAGLTPPDLVQFWGD